jgi:hypothetical protein
VTAGASALRIDQTLHGYDRGHKEIASSLRLDEQARATMLIYSDLHAEVEPGSKGGYLTCYPLPTASRHVLARTWSAGAGYRPGSVWTQSLQIDYQAIALVSDLTVLETLLRRSGGAEATGDLKPLRLLVDMSTAGSDPLGANAATAISGLYGSREGIAVVPSTDQQSDDLLALALWRQMWPGLRRAFTFVTGPGAGQPGAGADWMLRFDSNLDVASKARLDDGLQVLLEDLSIKGPTSLRAFLSRYAPEAANPKAIAGLLAELWSTPKTSLEARLQSARRVGGGNVLPRLGRDLVSQEIETNLDPTALIAILEQFGDQVLDIDPDDVVRIAAAMNEGALARLLSLSSSFPADQLGGAMFRSVVTGMARDRLVYAARDTNRHAMAKVRPDLLNVDNFWPSDDAARASLLETVGTEIGFAQGVRFFGLDLGPRTLTVMLERNLDGADQALADLLVTAGPQATRIAAQRIVSTPSLLEAVLERLKSPVALEVLAQAQIQCIRVPSAPAEWCAADIRVGMVTRGVNALIVCFTATLLIDQEPGLTHARTLYDPLQRLIEDYSLSREQQHYLETVLLGQGRARRLSERVASAALTRWPPRDHQAEALTLTSDMDHFRVLADQAVNHFGRKRLQDATSDPRLAPEARKTLTRKLEPGWTSWWT